MEISEVLAIIGGSKTARDFQKEVGPSEIGGCRRKVWHRLQGTEPMNETYRLAAWMGTAIHKGIERAFDVADPFSERYLRETEVAHEGLMGHVDCYDKETRTVIDWKTTSKKNLRYFPSQQQRTQVHLYGLLMESNGYPVDSVELVAIARDGNEKDVTKHSEPFDRGIALAGVAWLEDVKGRESAPDPEQRVSFCRDYCEFYDATETTGCGGVK